MLVVVIKCIYSESSSDEDDEVLLFREGSGTADSKSTATSIDNDAQLAAAGIVHYAESSCIEISRMIATHGGSRNRQRQSQEKHHVGYHLGGHML